MPIYLFIVAVLLSPLSLASIEVVDYSNRRVTLDKPATKIIALAPHIVENLYAAGAGEKIVGAVDYCDYPVAAKKIPRVGGLNSYSLEAIVQLQPDLIIYWPSGGGDTLLQKLENLDFTVYVSNPLKLSDVPRSIRDYGALTGNKAFADTSAQSFENRHQELQSTYTNKNIVLTLYQIWNDPIQTVNNSHIISDVIQLCGGVNVFGGASAMAPKISVESVIAKNPDAIIASGINGERPQWLNTWRKWQGLTAVKNEQLHFIPPDIIQRHTTRILEGATMMCEYLDQARQCVDC